MKKKQQTQKRWTEKEDEVFLQIMKQHEKEGKSQSEGLRKIASLLNRGERACTFRWYKHLKKTASNHQYQQNRIDEVDKEKEITMDDIILFLKKQQEKSNLLLKKKEEEIKKLKEEIRDLTEKNKEIKEDMEDYARIFEKARKLALGENHPHLHSRFKMEQNGNLVRTS